MNENKRIVRFAVPGDEESSTIAVFRSKTKYSQWKIVISALVWIIAITFLFWVVVVEHLNLDPNGNNKTLNGDGGDFTATDGEFNVVPSSPPQGDEEKSNAAVTTDAPTARVIYVPSISPTDAEYEHVTTTTSTKSPATSYASFIPTLRVPSAVPSLFPKANIQFPPVFPILVPTAQQITHIPTITPTFQPSAESSNIPSLHFSLQPSSGPSGAPSKIISSHPTHFPSLHFSLQPSSDSSGAPSKIPSLYPTYIPSLHPSSTPSGVPHTSQPTTKKPHYSLPTRQPDTAHITYFPGLLAVHENGIKLSQGLTSRIIARFNETVIYYNQTRSRLKFHGEPDAGACFLLGGDVGNAGENGWVYASNSELKDKQGGVGAITFDPEGRVVGYDMILENTTRNCGGGRTYWNTWISCEEYGTRGQIFETYPDGSRRQARQTVLGTTGGNFESMSYDNRNPFNPTFYITHDSKTGELRRYTPHPEIVNTAVASHNYTMMLHDDGVHIGAFDYLVLNAAEFTFEWSNDISLGKTSASLEFPNAEGIDVRDGYLYFVSKVKKLMIVLNLDEFTYEQHSTNTGSFRGQPDQIKFIVGSETNHNVIYFTEEASQDNGIHGRWVSSGRRLQIVEDDSWGGETTGLAFSPNKKHMYFAFQTLGVVFDVWREDGLPFDGETLDIKYHSVHEDL